MVLNLYYSIFRTILRVVMRLKSKPNALNLSFNDHAKRFNTKSIQFNISPLKNDTLGNYQM